MGRIPAAYIQCSRTPFLAAEKGALGMEAIASLVRTFDPDGAMAHGILLEDGTP